MSTWIVGKKPNAKYQMKLNLGCGSDYRQDYTNVDQPRAVTPKDLAVDLSVLPWPFDDNSADEILMMGSLEHLPDPHKNVIEVHRILKPGGLFYCTVPYAKSDGAFQSMEHKCFFTEKSFDYFCGISGYDAFGGPLFEMISVKFVQPHNTIKTRLILLLPFRNILKWFLWNMYDSVEFVMRKRNAPK